jgi:hypothetical protein
VESCASQNFRSSASVLKTGIDLSLLMGFSLLSVHVSRRDDPKQGSILAKGESNMKQPVLGCLPHSCDLSYAPHPSLLDQQLATRPS